MATTKSKFAATQNKGFQMTFDNGYTISVQFGLGNYCNNRNKPTNEVICESQDAEVMVWDSEGETVEVKGYKVYGYTSTNEVADIIEYVKNL